MSRDSTSIFLEAIASHVLRSRSGRSERLRRRPLSEPSGTARHGTARTDSSHELSAEPVELELVVRIKGRP